MFHKLSWKSNISDFFKVKSSTGLPEADRTKVESLKYWPVAAARKSRRKKNGFASVKLLSTVNLDVELSPESVSQGARMS